MSFRNNIPLRFQQGAIVAAQALANVNDAILAAHVNLDGDALGSLAACAHILKDMDKKCAIFSSTGIPQYLYFLEVPVPVVTDLSQLKFNPQFAIYLDCSDAGRLGHELGHRYEDWPSINIDHHLTGKGLGSIANYIDPTAAATSQLMAYVAIAMGVPLKGELAESIALGLMTDTGGFCHGNTTADVFSLCAYLVQNGCEISELRAKLHNNWTVNRLRLWGEALSKVSVTCHGKVALCEINQGDLRRHHCAVEDLEGLVEWFKRIRGVEVSAVLREEGRDFCKFSMRSTGPVDVRSMAEILGGGGHYNAAGGTIHLPITQAKEKLLDAVEKILIKQNHIHEKI